jgi:predicted nucleic acid-binding protein
LILVDTGPLVALVDNGDQYHDVCASIVPQIREPLATVWPVLSETMHLLTGLPKAQQAIWAMIERGAIALLPLGLSDIPRIRELMAKYADRPMDLADAALIHVAEREGIRKIFTVDKKDFAVYRLHGRTRPTLLP